MEFAIDIILGVIVAATPLLYASLGELVAEKSGVLNLGVEGMMVIGAIAAFSTTIGTGSMRRAFWPQRWPVRSWPRCLAFSR